MRAELEHLRVEAEAAIAAASDTAALERQATAYLGRNGKLTSLLRGLPDVPTAERPATGQLANAVKAGIERAVVQRRAMLSRARAFDPSLPGERIERGHLHPLTQFSREVLNVWRSFGYDLHEGPELERDWYNFEGLNIPPDHPSRDIQDTFFVAGHPDLVLRTHSSTVQLRALLHRRPPLRFVEVGRVYRHEATDASHESMFTQCDGIVIDRDLTMATLVTTLKTFLRRLFGDQAEIRVRPSYFPFVEPGIEMDMAWTKDGKQQWLELLGAGMVHPRVLEAMEIDPKTWRGFAFGMGLDRLMMLKFGIPDVRLAYSGNLNFLTQF